MCDTWTCGPYYMDECPRCPDYSMGAGQPEGASMHTAVQEIMAKAEYMPSVNPGNGTEYYDLGAGMLAEPDDVEEFS